MKKKNPRAFIGTLTSGEAEFQEASDVIAKQEGVSVTHHVISGLPEREAHLTLWESWNNVRHDYDLFVKIDADTILQRPTAIKELYTLLSKHSGPAAAQVPLWDYFTNQEILGLNAFSAHIEFEENCDNIYTDRVSFTPCTLLRGNDVSHLAPIGWHGKYPNVKQAFFFGYHRIIKRQYNVIKSVAVAWKQKGGEARKVALLGAVSAMCNSYALNDYSSPGFLTKIERVTSEETMTQQLNKVTPLLLKLNEDTIVNRAISKTLCRHIIPLFFSKK